MPATPLTEDDLKAIGRLDDKLRRGAEAVERAWSHASNAAMAGVDPDGPAMRAHLDAHDKAFREYMAAYHENAEWWVERAKR